VFLLITLNDTHAAEVSGRVIGPSQRPLPDNTWHSQQTPMPPVEFEPSISASERPQTHALDGAATGIGHLSCASKTHFYICIPWLLSLAWNAFECKVLQGALFSSHYLH
jgi:hypothetical protein